MKKILSYFLISFSPIMLSCFQSHATEGANNRSEIFNRQKSIAPQELKNLIAENLDAIAQEYYDNNNYEVTKKQWDDFLFNLSNTLTRKEKEVASEVLKEICDAGVIGDGDESRAAIKLSLSGLTDLNSDEETYLAGKVCERYQSLQNDLSAPQESNTLQSATLDQFEALPLTDVLDEFKDISTADLFQTMDGGACILYSFLWGVHANQILTKALTANIKKFEGRYYIKNPITGKINIISQDDIKSVNPSLHPSRNPLLRAIGIYVLAALNEYLGGEISGENFVLTVDGKDLFFGKNILELRQKSGDHLTLNSDGTITVIEGSDKKAKTISGDFVISVGGVGHAQVVYFDKSKGHWFQFNNQSSSSKDIEPFPVDQVNYPGMLAIGFMEVHD